MTERATGLPRAAARPPRLDPRAVRGIVFDLDGTLIDSYDAIAESLNHARAAFDLPALESRRVRQFVGHGLEGLISDQLGEPHVAAGVRLFRERYAAVFLERTRALRGVARVLGELDRRGYRMAVASNKPARFGEAILRHVGLDGHFACVQGPDRAGVTKPHPAMLGACLQALGLRRSQALYVGDMVLDVETAARARLPVVLVCGGSSRPAELRATGQLVLERLDALPDLLS